MLDPMNILLLKMGSTMPSVKAKYGDYEDWFAAALEIPRKQLLVVDAHAHPKFPANDEFDALIISGSAHAVYDHEAWSENAADWIESQIDAKTPILGVCYGHQLIAQRLGATVGLSPGGREIGVCSVDRIKSDPIFDGLANQFKVVQTHSDAILTTVPGAHVLASSPQAANQAMAIGDHIRTVQWHPEITANIIEEYIQIRRSAIEDEFDASHVDELLAQLEPAPSGRRILHNFIRHFVRKSP